MEDSKDINSLLLQEKWEASFYQIVEQYSERLLYCAHSILKDEVKSQDALQEAFISIWKNLHKFKGDSQPFTWCYTIVKNSALNELRKEKKHLSDSIDPAMGITSSEELKWDSNEIEERLQEVLTDLPEKQRLVFELRYFQDMSFKDIAELTGTSIGALKASYHHAKGKVEEKLIGQLNLP